jgi:hypothetical protein
MLYAKVKADQVISIHQAGSPYTDEEGTRYPTTIWSIPDWLEKNGFLQINLYTKKNEVFYRYGTPTYVYDKKNNAVDETIKETEKDVSEIKKYLKSNTLSGCESILEATDFYINRNSEDSSYAVPDDVTKHRKQVYDHFDECTTAINDADTHAKCVALIREVSMDEDGKKTVTGKLWDWPVYEESGGE